VNRPAYLDELYKLSRRGEFEEIVSRCKKIIAELAARPTDAYPETAQIHECLANAYYDDCDYCAAALEFESALRLYRAHQHVPTDDVVRCSMYLGRMFLWTGRPVEAEELLCEALTLLDHLPEENQFGRAFVLIDLAQLHRKAGELEIAEHLLLQAIRPMLHYCGYGSRHYGFLFFHLGSVYELQGRATAADKTMKKAFHWLRWAIDEDDDNFATVLSYNGVRLQQRGRLNEARAAQTEVVAILERIRKPGHYLLEKAKVRLAKLDDTPIPSSS
jgi:tetratricopeptide (TPR) repeat protein